MKITDYYNITNNAEIIKRFSKLVQKLMFDPENFNKENAREVLDIIDNNKEDVEDLAQAFRNSGEDIKKITSENWEMLRNLMVAILEQ